MGTTLCSAIYIICQKSFKKSITEEEDLALLPAAFAPGSVKTHNSGYNTYCQWGAKYINKVHHLFLLFGLAYFRRPVLSVFISLVIILRPRIKSTIAATTPPIKIISCGISLLKIPPITTLPITSLLRSSRYFPASPSRVVRFFGFFMPPILHGGVDCFEKCDVCHAFLPRTARTKWEETHADAKAQRSQRV